jgi:hypothetical protein
MARRTGNNQTLTDTGLSNWTTVLTFECPACGNDRFHEMWVATITFQITGLDMEKGILVEGLEVVTRDGIFFGYCCSQCGDRFKKPDGTPVRCERELVTYLEKQLGNYHLKAEEYRNRLLMRDARHQCVSCAQPCNDYLREVRGKHKGLTH